MAHLTPEQRVEKSNRDIEYKCTECERSVGRDNLKVKRVQFKEMGVNGPIVQTRVIAWLCTVAAENGGPSCLDKDPVWQQPARVATPGHADTLKGK